jgi:hypothetical protein
MSDTDATAAAWTPYTPPRSTCQVCGGLIRDRGLFRYQGVWIHAHDEDWRTDPHNAVPDPADIPQGNAR